MYVTQFTVEGFGEFPVDMLRYDSCWPGRPEDAAAIIDHGDFRTRRAVQLVTAHATKGYPKITDDRWSSFGWQVIDRATA